MNYRKVGKYGIKVSEVSLGSWLTYGTASSNEMAESCVRRAYEVGINFFDCADAYGNYAGESERILGEILSDYERSTYVVSSKVFFNTGKYPNDGGLSRKHIFEQVDKSLKNLKTDYLDFYFCHRYDINTPLEETIRAMSDLVTQGKVLYYGVSEWSPVQITNALHIVNKSGYHPLVVDQPQYNMFDRYIEDEIIPICDESGMGIVVFSPLAQGALSGKYRKGQEFPADSRAAGRTGDQVREILNEETLDKIERLNSISEELGLPLSQMALAWILRKPQISSVIIGATKPEQIDQNVKATEISLSPYVLDEIDKILGYKPFKRQIG